MRVKIILLFALALLVSPCILAAAEAKPGLSDDDRALLLSRDESLINELSEADREGDAKAEAALNAAASGRRVTVIQAALVGSSAKLRLEALRALQGFPDDEVLIGLKRALESQSIWTILDAGKGGDAQRSFGQLIAAILPRFEVTLAGEADLSQPAVRADILRRLPKGNELLKIGAEEDKMIKDLKLAADLDQADKILYRAIDERRFFVLIAVLTGGNLDLRLPAWKALGYFPRSEQLFALKLLLANESMWKMVYDKGEMTSIQEYFDSRILEALRGFGVPAASREDLYRPEARAAIIKSLDERNPAR